jgi:hypothetical protein
METAAYFEAAPLTPPPKIVPDELTLPEVFQIRLSNVVLSPRKCPRFITVSAS